MSGLPLSLWIIPSPYSYHNSDVTIDGTAVDANGVSDVDISFDNGSTWDSITITPATSVSWSYTLPVNADGSDDDTYSYIVRCIDDYGSSAMENGQFTVDSTDPTNVINRPGTGDYVNGDMVISGTSGDNISLSEVYYNIALSTDPVPVFPDDYALLSGTYAWEETIDTTLLSDDLYALRIGSIDIAGNESAVSSVNFTVDQSSDIPVFAYTNADADYDTLAEASGNLLETGAKIIGNITDDDSVDYTTIAVTVYNSDDSVMTAETAVSNPPSANGTFLNWSHDLSALPDGEYYAVFTADDINGVTATTGPLFFTIDLSPASIDVASPLSGSYQSADFTITGTASDENGLLFGDHDGDGGATTAETDYIEIYDGSSWQNAAVDVAGNWSCDIDVSALGDGSKTYQFRATDLFGKSATDTLSFTIDTVAPAISVVSPAGGDWTNVNSLSLNGTASDANGVVSVEVSTNYADWSSLTGTLSWSGLLDISGEADQLNKTIYFRSTDIAGNTVNDTVDINIDRTVPTLEETAIGTTETQYESSGYSLSGTLSDNLTGSLPTYDHDSDGGAVTEEVEYIEISLNAGPSELVPVSGGTWNYPVSFSGGTMDYELSITDRAGNSSYYLTRTVIEDDSAPSLDSIVTPTGAESYLSGSAYSLTGTASDTGDAGLDSVYWWAGDQGASAPSTASPYTDWNSAVGTASWSGTLDLSSLGEGDKTLHAFAVDKCGNASSVSTVDSMVDQAAPVLDEDGLGGSSASASGDVSFEITITESNGIVHGDLLDGAPVEDVDYFEVMINGSDWAADAVRAEYTGADMTYTVSAADFSDGDNEVLFRAIDLAGRTSSVIKRDIFFDNTPPVVTFINLDTSSVVNGESLTVQGTTTDSASTISSVTIAYNGPEDSGYSSEQTVSGSFYSWTYELDLTPSDVYYSDNPISLRVTATDGAGNTSQSELTFAIDQEGDMPALNLSGINVFAQSATAAVTSDDYILAGVLCDDDGVDLDSLSVIFDSSSLSYRVISGSDDDTAITWFADLSGYAEGTYGFSVTADDSLGNTAEGNHSGMIDSEIPVLGSDGKISGSAEDDDAFDSSSLVLLQNGSDQSGSVAIGADSTYVPWSYELPASDDLYFFEINGADATGAAIPVDWAKYGGESLKTMVLKDSGNPVITVTSPSQGAYVNGTAATSGSAYDDLAINSLTITAVQSDNVTSVELTSDPGVALDTTEGTGEYYYDSSAGQYVWDFALERLPGRL